MTDEIRSYKDLHVWRKAMSLAEVTYVLTTGFPKSEIYGLVSQMRRAAVSIPSNIAEGHARCSTREYLRFLSIAAGSIAELETQLSLCERLGLLQSKDVEPLMTATADLGKQLRVLRQSLQGRLETHLREPEAEYGARLD